MVEWYKEENTPEPLSIIYADDTDTCDLYTDNNILLREQGWRNFLLIEKRLKKLPFLVKQEKLRSPFTPPC